MYGQESNATTASMATKSIQDGLYFGFECLFKFSYSAVNYDKILI